MRTEGIISHKVLPDPTPETLADPRFEAVWQCIKTWDIGVPEAYSGYTGAMGHHVRAILDAIDSEPKPAASPIVIETKKDHGWTTGPELELPPEAVGLPPVPPFEEPVVFRVTKVEESRFTVESDGMDYQPVTVEAAKQIAETFGKNWVVVFSGDKAHGLMHTTTYGRSPQEKLLAARIGDELAVALGADLSLKESFEDFRHLPAAEAKAKLDAAEARIAELEAENQRLRDTVASPPESPLGPEQPLVDLRAYRLFVWRGLFKGESEGLAFAIARSGEEARELLRQSHASLGDSPYIDLGPNEARPIKPYAYGVSGGQ